MAKTPPVSLIDRAADAALELAAARPWNTVTLGDIAVASGVDLADLFDAADSKGALVAHVAARFDRAALQTPADGDVHDRLFDAAMARVEAMEPHRAALLGIARDENPLQSASRTPRTARAILEGAGIDATAPRLTAMTAVWVRIVQVWRADEGALNRTMAEIDKRLKQMREQLGKLGQGF